MIDHGIVQGSKEQAVPLIINHDEVYVHDNIKQIEDTNLPDMEDKDITPSELYEYHEYIYTRDEYTVMSNNKKDEQITANATSIEDLTVMISELVGSE